MKKILSLLLVAVLVFGLAACGSNGTENTNNAANTNNTENAVNTENSANTANDTNNTNNEENYDVSGIINPLTGEATEEDLSKYRPIALSMNNEKAAMPQHGITDADIIIEMNVEKGNTRMLSLFQKITSGTEKLGAIRSARTYFVDWALAFDTIYITASGAANALAKIQEKGVPYVNCNDNAVFGNWVHPIPNIFARDRDRLNAGYALEHTMFAYGNGFENHIEDLKVQLEHRKDYECSLKFTTKPQTENGSVAAAFTVTMNPAKTTDFEYDNATKLYKVSQHGGPYIDGNNKEQLAIKNVLVLNTKYWPESAGAVRYYADMSGGTGVYACEGKMIDINWARTDEGGLVLTKADGSDLKLAVGKTFIICPNSETGGLKLK